MQQFFSVADVAKTLDALVDEVRAIRANPLADKHLGMGKKLGLLFFNPSLRTRVSTELAARNLGMDVQVLHPGGDSWKLELNEGATMDGLAVEHIKDAAGVLGRYFDILGVRSFANMQSQADDYAEGVFTSLTKFTKIPILSLESATRHPLQSLADLVTIRQLAQKPNPKIVLAWAPHIKPIPQAVANSFAEWMLAAGHSLTIANPPGYDLATAFSERALTTNNLAEALEGADFVYVKNWASYEPYGQVLRAPDWMLTEKHLEAAPEAKVMHCLPVRRNVELSDEILDGPRSIVSEQAENRIYAAQAILKRMLVA